jgi:hypothetical protein
MRPYMRLQNLFVREIDTTLSKETVISELSNYCSPSQGKVVVPVSDTTGSILGIAYLNYLNQADGAQLGGSSTGRIPTPQRAGAPADGAPMWRAARAPHAACGQACTMGCWALGLSAALPAVAAAAPQPAGLHTGGGGWLA